MKDRLGEIKELIFQARVDPNRVGALSLWLDLADIDWLIATIEQQAREIERLCKDEEIWRGNHRRQLQRAIFMIGLIAVHGVFIFVWFHVFQS